MYEIKNLKDGAFSVDNVSWQKGETKTLIVVSQGIIDEVEAGNLSSDKDLTPLGGLSDVASTINTLVNSTTGTAATPSGGNRTLAAVSDTATAANAIAGLLAEANTMRGVINALVTRVNLQAEAINQLSGKVNS